MSEQKVTQGVLTALVYRTRRGIVYLSHEGAHDALELCESVCEGGDWEEAAIYTDDDPPMPPDEVGLWQLRLPWRDAVPPTAEEKADEDYDDGDDETEGGEIACLYSLPEWTKLTPSPSVGKPVAWMVTAGSKESRFVADERKAVEHHANYLRGVGYSNIVPLYASPSGEWSKEQVDRRDLVRTLCSLHGRGLSNGQIADAMISYFTSPFGLPDDEERE